MGIRHNNGQAGLTKPVRVAIDRLFAKWDKENSPGVSLGVIVDDGFAYRRCYGMASLEHAVPIKSDSVFRVGSMAKQFTAACVLMATERGSFSLDDDIREHIPELKWRGRAPCMRHLLYHTGGVPDYLNLMADAGFTDDDFYLEDDALDILARRGKPAFAPGTKWEYSNSGYFLLSVAIERATGLPLRQFAERRLFAPLGMGCTHFHDDHTMIVRNRACGYAPRRGGFCVSETQLGIVGDGGLFTTVDDLLMWNRNFYDGKVGGSLVGRMSDPGTLDCGSRLDYACGLELGRWRGRWTVSHNGFFAGFCADMVRIPQERLTVVCLANLATVDSTRLAFAVVGLVLG